MSNSDWRSGPGGVLGPKIAGGVPWATENWTPKDRGENGVLGPKRSNFVRICTQKIVFVLVDEKKHPKKIEFGTQRVKKGGQNRGMWLEVSMSDPSSQIWDDKAGCQFVITKDPPKKCFVNADFTNRRTKVFFVI